MNAAVPILLAITGVYGFATALAWAVPDLGAYSTVLRGIDSPGWDDEEETW